MRLKLFVAGVVCAGVALALPPLSAADAAARYQAIVDARGRLPEPVRVQQLFKVGWEIAMEENPEFATLVGFPGQDHRWTDLSPEAIARRRQIPHAALAAVNSIDPAALGPIDRVSYELFKQQTEQLIESERFPLELLPVNQLAGVQQDAAQTLAFMPNRTVPQLENQLARLRALPQRIEQTIALLEQGLARGVTPPQIALRDVPQQVLNQIVDDPLASPLLRGFASLPSSVPGEEQQRLRGEAAAVYREQVVPAWQKLHAYLADHYVPRARKAIAATALPDGEAWYAYLVRTQTTTDLTPQQIHEIGLREVARIRAGMEKVKASTGFTGSLAEFFAYLRTDPKFYFTDKADLLRAYRDIAKRADPELIKLFRTLPRLPYGVLPVPSYAEKSQTTAYYYPGAAESGRPGYFFANTYALHTRPKWEMEALTLHEAVPGHHLQIALAQEIEGLPEFRAKSWAYTAFVEGWGLYAESLGEEMGLYQDPYSKFGQLTYEMWRAIRLVTDTGMHALGWSRQQAIDYFMANAGKTENDIVVEVDRYLVWPGQALAYKLGELKIKELRADATRELGAKFDVRAFHDEVLRHGAIPLELLERNLRAWMAAQR
ncbi:MAG TPA: DUF885 domain-containing protein [Opitutaceae bacterium]